MSRVGPFEAHGTYQVAATLYNNNEPVPAADGHVVTASSGKRLHRSSGDVRIDSGMCLSGLHLDAASKVVFEVIQAKNSVVGAVLQLAWPVHTGSLSIEVGSALGTCASCVHHGFLPSATPPVSLRSAVERATRTKGL